MKKFAVGLLAVVSAAALAQDRVAMFDMNSDGKVDFIELSTSCEVSKSLFERADKNNDGLLSNTELRAAKAYLLTKCDKEENNA